MAAQQQSQENSYSFRVSILIPMYNEADTIVFVLNRVKKALEKENFEIIVVDDGSQDGSAEQVNQFIDINPELPIQYFYQNNQGKGGAIRAAMTKAQGEIYVVQDADMEYSPEDILPLLDFFEKGEQVVYGSRNLNKEERKHSSVFFYWGGLLVTWCTNLLFGSNLTDEATGYKLFHADLMKDLSFKHNDFAWEPELTAKILKKKITIVEHPISYHPRSKVEGKKISWQDGVKAIWVLFCEFIKR